MPTLQVVDELVVTDLESLWRVRRTALIGTVAAITRDPDAATDAVDEAFARAFARRARVESMASPTGWIVQVALNVVRRSKTRQSRRHLAEVGAAGRDWIAPTDPRHDVWAAVAALPPRERMAVALRYVADLTEPEIASILGVAVGTVSASLTSARRKLASELDVRDEVEGS